MIVLNGHFTLYTTNLKELLEIRSWWDLDPRPRVYKTLALTGLSYMTNAIFLKNRCRISLQVIKTFVRIACVGKYVKLFEFIMLS